MIRFKKKLEDLIWTLDIYLAALERSPPTKNHIAEIIHVSRKFAPPPETDENITIRYSNNLARLDELSLLRNFVREMCYVLQ